MCGITGFIDFTSKTTKEDLEAMVQQMHHRGPDDYGAEICSTENYSIGLGQTRLSIIDLSSAGHQPMHHAHLSIVFNGEVYNYKEIKNELENLQHTFTTNSDTEVVIHAYMEWGKNAVSRFIGMFVFAIYDDSEQRITFFRDRAGVKPLFLYQNENLVLFGSELKALMKHPRFVRNIDVGVLPNFLQYGYIAAPYCIFHDCKKLLPGHFVDYCLKTKKVYSESYWNIQDYFKKPNVKLDFQEAKYELKKLLISAFQYRMVADVPVGVFLSGGYDSTLVSAILQSNQENKLKTFTIGFEEGNNEAPFARQTAKHLGTDHYEHICTTKEAQKIIPDLPFYFDEPFGDSSAIPTILVSQLAKKHVTVALSADGGDELFCGYASYFKLYDYLHQIGKIPLFIKPILKTLPGFWIKYLFYRNEEKQHQMKSALKSLNFNKISEASSLFRFMNEKPLKYINGYFKESIVHYPSSYIIDINGYHNELDLAMSTDFQSYLQNDILTKVDRASMSVSLEGREPLLDHRIAEFAAQLPLEYKYSGKDGKIILKEIVHEIIPKDMMDRPKSGFSLPIYKWLRGDLLYLLDEYLSEEALADSGVWDVPFVLEEVSKFKKKQMYYVPVLWNILMFQMWYKRWM